MQNKTKQKARKAIQAIMAKPGAFPLLCAHLRAGTLWLEGTTWSGSRQTATK